jgi:hypothetical protein
LVNLFGSARITRPGGPVVSLTTYGKRVNTVYLAIESIAGGSVLPSRLILWLDDEASFRNLPSPLRRLRKRGLEVFLSPNHGPHTKYYPYVESHASFDTPLVTADDDILYPQSWLEGLLEAFREYPDAVNCYRARVITLNDHGMADYAQWELCGSTEPSVCHFATGVSGVVYPPQFLPVLKRAGTAFQGCCPIADDIWLHVHAIRAGYRIRQIRPESLHFPTIPGTQDVSLFDDNVQHGENDMQAKATYRQDDIQILRTQCQTPASYLNG